MAFARTDLRERSARRHLAELLDTLHEHAAELVPALIESRLGDIPLRVLEKALDVHGTDVEPARLARMAYRDEPVPVAQSQPIYLRSASLGSRIVPRSRRAVYLESLRSSGSDNGTQTRPFWPFAPRDLLHGSRLPADFGLWCLKQAVALNETEPAVSRMLLSSAHVAIGDPAVSVGLTIETMRQRVRGHPALEEHLDGLLRPPAGPAERDTFEREAEAHRQRMAAERRQVREEWAAALREHEIRASREPVLACEPELVGDGISRPVRKRRRARLTDSAAERLRRRRPATGGGCHGGAARRGDTR